MGLANSLKWMLALAALTLVGIASLRAASLSTADSVAASVAFLAQRQDEFHNRFPVYDDVSSAGNHFLAFAKIGRDTAVAATVNGSWPTNPHSGATCIRFQFVPRDALDYAGFYMQNGVLAGAAPLPN